MAKKKPVPPPKPKRNSSCLLLAFLLFAACVIIAALAPKTSGAPGPTDIPAATDTLPATLSNLQVYRTSTWDALTALSPTRTQQAQDRADTATWTAINAIIFPTDAPTQKSITQLGGANSPLAKCRDGSYWSGTEHRGACSGHKGVAVWNR